MRILQAFLVCALCAMWVTESAAQELTPRLFWPTPKGTRVMVAGYSYSFGGVLLDQSIPVEDADSRLNSGILAFTQTLDLWGRTSNILFNLPYARGTTKGSLSGEPVARDFNAFGDFSVAMTVNLRGAPTMTREEFMAFRANPRPIIGASIKLVAPTGQYHSDRVVNVGANRWATQLKLGGVILLKPKWLLELSASTWFFGDDNDYVSGRRQQDPIFAVESSIIKRIRPGLWASLDATYFRGGRQTIDGEPLIDYQNNLKVGGTFVMPFLGRHAIKVGYATGIITTFGNDFDQFLLSYQVALK